MAYYEDCLALVLPQDPLARAIYPARGVGEAFSARRRLLRIVLPGHDGFRPPGLDLGDGESFPFAEVRLAQILICRGGQTQFAGDYSGGGGGARQRRAYDGVNVRPARQPMRGRANLAGASRAEGLIGEPAEPVFR